MMHLTRLCIFTLVPFFSLMCADINWSSTPVTLSTVGADASDPQVVIDPNANITAVWIENGIVKSKIQLANMSWSSSSVLSNSGAASPQLAVDSNGNATAVWVENGVIKASTMPFLSSWNSAVALSSTGASAPRLAVDSSGDLVAIWIRSGNIESATKLVAGSWPASPNVLSTTGTADSPQLAIGGNGNVVAVWHDVVTSVDTIFSASKLVNGSWSTAQTITWANGINPVVAVDASGNAVAGWYQFDATNSMYSNVIFQTAYQPMSGDWTTPVNVSKAGIYNPSKLMARLGFDAAGNAIALWTTSINGSTFSIEASILPLNGSWTTPGDLVALNLYSWAFDLKTVPSGYSFVVFMLNNIPNLSIQATGTDIANPFRPNFWAVSQTISLGNANGFPSLAAINNNGYTAAAVWINFDGNTNIIQAVTGTGNDLQPPTALQVQQGMNNFGVLTEYYNTLSWQPSPSTGFEGYVIFRNGVMINQVDPTVLQIIDDNQIDPVTYGIAVFSDDFDISEIATVNFP